MNVTIQTPILHRPSRRINRVALPTAYSRVGKRNKAAAGPSSVFFTGPSPSPFTRSSPLDPSSRIASPEHDLLSRTVRLQRPSPISVFRPRCPVHLGAFNVRSLRQVGQQTALALTLHSLTVDVCCISETRIYDCSTVVELSAPSISARYFLRSSGDDTSTASGQAGVGIVLSSRAEASLLDWIPVNSRLCAVRLGTSINVNVNRSSPRCLFVIAAYAPTNCSSDSIKDEFYDDLHSLLCRAKSSDIVLLAGDFNAQVGRLEPSESDLGGTHGLDVARTDNGDRLLQICASHKLFLSSTAFRHKMRQCVTWRPPAPDQPWTQIDHIAVSHRWRGCIDECRSLWSTSLDSDHALVRCRFALRFPGKRLSHSSRLATDRLLQPEVRQSYQSNLAAALCSPVPGNVGSAWCRVARGMKNAATAACGTAVEQRKRHWVSERSLDLLGSRRQVPSGVEHNVTRRIIRRELNRSLKQDREHWWSQKAEEMEQAHNAGNIRRLFQLIRSTGAKRLGVSETICERDDSLICNKQRRLARWAEHFQDQFSWPAASNALVSSPPADTWSVNMEAPTASEVNGCISALKRFKAAGPDDLVPTLFREGGEVLCAELTRLFQLIWEQETVPDNWGESIVVPIFKKGLRSDCANHRGISLTPVISRLFASLLLRRLTLAREKQIREEQAGFRPGRGCIDHIFTLRQILEQRHVYRQPTLAVFLDFKGAFDSVDRAVLLDTLVRKGMPAKYVNIIRALYSQTSGRVRVYGELSTMFSTESGVRQGCPLSPFLFNFAIDAIMEECLQCATDSGVHVLPGSRLLDLDYADDIVLLFDSVQAAQSTLDRLSEVVPSFGMRFAPQKCKVLPQDIELPESALVLQNEKLEVVPLFTYLGSCISSDASVTREVDTRISKARLTFRSLNHLWRHRGISLHLKGRIYSTTVRAVLLYGCETWTSHTDDIRRLQVFDHRCLRSICGIGWGHRIRNEVVRKRVLGGGLGVDRLVKLYKLRWLGHVLRMPSTRLPQRVLFAASYPEWHKARGGQLLTWQRQMKALVSGLSRAGSVRLPGWGPRDSCHQWLLTLQDMARNRAQWRSCCKHLIDMDG